MNKKTGKYFPNNLFLSIGQKATIKISKPSGLEDEEVATLQAYCGLFKSSADLYKRVRKGPFKNQEFDSIKIGLDDKDNIYPILDIDGQSYALNYDSNNTNLITRLLIENGTQPDKSLAGPFKLRSEAAGERLVLSHISEADWDNVSNNTIREKGFGADELKIGHVYRQIKKHKSYSFLYLGRVRDPTNNNKLCFLFMKFLPFDDDLISTDNIFSIKNKFSGFFTYEDKPLKRTFRMDRPILISTSIPTRLIFDDGIFDISKASPDGADISNDTIESMAQQTIDEQWIEYQQRVEIAKASGVEKTDRYSQKKVFTWVEPSVPYWLDYRKRIR